MGVEVRRVTDAVGRAAAAAIRRAVFVCEQLVPESLDVDGLDGDSAHFLASWAGRPVATARARMTSEGYKLERVAVLCEARGRAVGRALVEHVLRQAPPEHRVYLHAQHAALGFWQRLGFQAEGSDFYEAGIRHRRMVWADSGPAARPG